jgi:hypothetical protein
VFPITVVKVVWADAEAEYETEVDRVPKAEVFVELLAEVFMAVYVEVIVEAFVNGVGDRELRASESVEADIADELEKLVTGVGVAMFEDDMAALGSSKLWVELNDTDADELSPTTVADIVLPKVKVATGVSAPLFVIMLFVDAVLTVVEFRVAGPVGAPREAFSGGNSELPDALDGTIPLGDEAPLKLDVVNASEMDVVGVADIKDVELRNAGEEVEQP